MDFSKIRNIVFLVSLGVVSFFFVYIIKPIFYPLFWAAVIASLFYPLYKKLNNRLNIPNLSATLIIMLVILIILVPLTLVSGLLVKESIEIYNTLGGQSEQINNLIQKISAWATHNPLLSDLAVNGTFWGAKISEVASAISGSIFQTVKDITQNSVMFLVMFVAMLYALFFFIRDGEKILKKIMYMLPLGDANELMFYNKFTNTARAAIKGSLVIGLVQGGIGAILFAIVGIQGALIWGLVMMALSILIGGSYLVWGPAGIIMLILGNVWQGIVILVVGALVIGTIDNFLKPILVGRDIQMHPLLIFLSTLGGVFVFGLSGFIIGPVIVAFLQSFWEMYEHFYKNELDNN